MARLIINNKGIATVLAISIMIFIASIAVAVIPNINNLLKQNSLSADMLKAQMAAETGAKRAIAELYQGKDGDVSYSWIWLKNDRNLQGNNNSNGSYNVTITGATNLTGTVKPTSGKYTITSTGTYGAKTKTIKCDVEINNKFGKDTSSLFGLFSTGDINITGGGIVATDIMSTKAIDISWCTANKLYTPGAKNISDGLLLSHAIGSSKVDANEIFDDGIYPGIKKLPDSYFKNYQKLQANNFLNLYQYLEPGRYEVDGDLNFIAYNALNLNRSGTAIIHVKGDLNLVSMSRIGNILDSTKHFLIIVDGDVNIAANAGINNAVIVSYGKTLVAGMANIKGSLQSAQGIDGIFGTSYFYSGATVATFRDVFSKINYGEDTFEVSNWR